MLARSVVKFSFLFPFLTVSASPSPSLHPPPCGGLHLVLYTGNRAPWKPNWHGIFFFSSLPFPMFFSFLQPSPTHFYLLLNILLCSFFEWFVSLPLGWVPCLSFPGALPDPRSFPPSSSTRPTCPACLSPFRLAHPLALRSCTSAASLSSHLSPCPNYNFLLSLVHLDRLPPGCSAGAARWRLTAIMPSSISFPAHTAGAAVSRLLSCIRSCMNPLGSG